MRESKKDRIYNEGVRDGFKVAAYLLKLRLEEEGSTGDNYEIRRAELEKIFKEFLTT